MVSIIQIIIYFSYKKSLCNNYIYLETIITVFKLMMTAQTLAGITDGEFSTPEDVLALLSIRLPQKSMSLELSRPLPLSMKVSGNDSETGPEIRLDKGRRMQAIENNATPSLKV